MIILQGAIHIFTEQPNSVAKSIYNGLRRQMTHLLEYETIKTSTNVPNMRVERFNDLLHIFQLLWG